MSTSQTAGQAAANSQNARQLHGAPPPRAVTPEGGRIALLLADASHIRLLTGLAAQLGLVADLLDPSAAASVDLCCYELILAHTADAHAIQNRLAAAPLQSDAVYPAIICVLQGGDAEKPLRQGSPSDAFLSLTQDPRAILAQLSVVLYAHRAFSQRYQSAMEELHLNRLIFSSVTSGISVADATQPDLPLTYVNPAFEIMTGYSLESTVGKNCRFLQQDEREQPGLAVLREAIVNRKQATVLLRNFRRDGSPFWNELFISPIRNREGELTHFVGIQNDVTARVEFEAALRQSEKLAAVGRLAASIAHEINNPLESVMNLLYLALHESDPALAKHYVQEADNEVKRIAIITTQSLRFYRQNTRARAVDGDELLTSVLDLYLPKLTRFNITTVHDRHAHVPVLCMESEIRQVISNLIRNSIDAMRPDPGRLQVRTRVATDWKTGRSGITFTVADSGAGIAPAVVKKLYTAFFTTKGDAGTGLGLWVSASIVERHNGRILVRSSEDPKYRGTVFSVFLPFDAVQETDEPAATTLSDLL